jgi:hypothetical protein
MGTQRTWPSRIVIGSFPSDVPSSYYFSNA